MKRIGIWLLFLLPLGAGLFFWHPVCVPIAGDEAKLYQGRGHERIWGVQTFKIKNGQLCQCKPWLARQLFF